jgi:formate dehydrogenase subunit gamma
MRRIQRQSSFARIVHWIHTIATLLLFYTGLALYTQSLNALAVVFGGIQNSRLVHHYSGFVFVGVPIMMGLANWDGLMRFFKEIFSWEGKEDTESLTKFPAYLFDADKEMPSQGRLKGGQKFADWFILGGSLLVSVSGIMIYFGSYISKSVVIWMFPLHELSMIVLGVFLLIHIYLGAGIFEPYRGMWRAMFGDGTVSERDAEYHWSKWAEEQK